MDTFLTKLTVVVMLAVASVATAQQPANGRRLAPVSENPTGYAYHGPQYVGMAPPGVFSHGATAAESYARGWATMVYAQGQYNLATAQANTIQQEARRRAIENRERGIQSYYAMRQFNREARVELGLLPNRTRSASQEEQLAANAAAPRPAARNVQILNDAGEIAWPTLLQNDVFTQQRGQLDRVFAERSISGRMSEEERAKVEQATNAMLVELKSHVRQVSPSEYMAARRFLETLAEEARNAVG